MPQTRRERWTLRAAELSGRALRRIGRSVPGVLGPILVAAGFALAWLPLGLIAAGAFLLLIDRRIPDEAPNANPVRYADGRDRLKAVV